MFHGIIVITNKIIYMGVVIMAKLLQEYGEIKNMTKTYSELRKFIKSLSGSTDAGLVQTLNKSCKEKNVVRYFTFTYQEMSEDESGKEVMWVDTGYTDIIGSPVYVQFTMSDYWTGALVGTETSILQNQLEYRRGRGDTETCKFLENRLRELGYSVTVEQSNKAELKSSSIENTEVKQDETNQVVTKQEEIKQDEFHEQNQESFISSLYSKLMIPNNWNEKALQGYIDSCISRINSCIRNGKDCSNFVIFNEANQRAAFNSGLLDRYGKSIMIVAYVYCDSSRVMQLMSTGLCFAESKIFMLATLGFSKENLGKKIERVEFCDSPLNLMFADGIDDFDLECRSRLEHCVGDRLSRYPEEYQGLSQDVLCSDIVKAIELGVELNKCDRSYIKPFYNRSKDCIEFIVPYHVMGNFQKKPELGIVISYFDGYWQIMTILSREDAMNDIKLFNMYENETF